MRFKWKMSIVVALALFIVTTSARPQDEEAALQKTKKELRSKGFKTDLSDFDFSASEDDYKCASVIMEADPSRWLPIPHQFELSGIINSNSAVVLWKQGSLIYPYKRDNLPVWQRGDVPPQKEDYWQILDERMNEDGSKLDLVAKALSSGHYAFDLRADDGNSMRLPHLAVLKSLAQAFTLRALLELHKNHHPAAYNNLLAATRVVTRWRTEPVEISHSVRYTCAELAFDATWQGLQAGGWADDELLTLENEWESTDFFCGLAEMPAFQGASLAHDCELERKALQNELKIPLKNMARDLRQSWVELKYYRQQRLYRDHGSYEDEKALLSFFYERQREIKRALPCTTWNEMRGVPGVTNLIFFRSKYRSRTRSRMALSQVSRQNAFRAQGHPTTTIASVAEMEARRRIVITAIALERFSLRHHSYPESLAQLVPEFMNREPLDFIDGKPLRYRGSGGHVILYSLGLDCADNDGIASVPSRLLYRQFGPTHTEGTDLIWPHIASDTQLAHKLEEDNVERERRRKEVKTIEAVHEKARQARMQQLRNELSKLCAEHATSKLEEPTIAGKTLTKLIRNDAVLGRSAATLQDLLTLKMVSTTNGPEIVAFELPIKYEVLTNDVYDLHLLVDSPRSLERKTEVYDDVADIGEAQACERAKNGNCLLLWDRTSVPAGEHFFQADLSCDKIDGGQHYVDFKGPLTMFNFQ